MTTINNEQRDDINDTLNGLLSWIKELEELEILHTDCSIWAACELEYIKDILNP